MLTQQDQIDPVEFELRDFEQQVVCKILRAGGLIGNIKSYVEEHKRYYGTPRLSFTWFRDRFPRFPVHLCPLLFEKRPPYWTEMFKNFTKTELFRAYDQAREGVAKISAGRPLGIVFNMDGITFVLHNHEPAIQLPGRRIVRQLGTHPITFAFEEFDTLLKCIDGDWTGRANETEKASWKK